MRIQAVIKICLSAKEEVFARPSDWRGSGFAIDLGRRTDPVKVRKLRPLGEVGACLGTPWDIVPEDLLGPWEIITLDELRQELS